MKLPFGEDDDNKREPIFDVESFTEPIEPVDNPFSTAEQSSGGFGQSGETKITEEVDSRDQVQYKLKHPDGAETIVVANKNPDGWSISATTRRNGQRLQETIGTAETKTEATTELLDWIEMNENGVTGGLF